mgnify:CR=1 FL=1
MVVFELVLVVDFATLVVSVLAVFDGFAVFACVPKNHIPMPIMMSPPMMNGSDLFIVPFVVYYLVKRIFLKND